MGRIQFLRKTSQASFLDPKDDTKTITLEIETRTDMLTGHRARILPYRKRALEGRIDPSLVEQSKKACPFCPERLNSSTPRLLQEIARYGRPQRGEATLVPNFFPYARYSWIVVVSKDHFVALDSFSEELLTDAFVLASEAVRKISSYENGFVHASINCNYLPDAGAALLHPHLQVVVEDRPTAFHQRVIDGIRRYKAEHNSDYWDDLVREELGVGERYIGREGTIHFLAAFSPLGILGEIIAVFKDRYTLEGVSEDDWMALSRGLVRIFGFLSSKNIHAFNLSVFSGIDGEHGQWVHARVCPRMLIPPWNTSDINYFEKLHNEVICVVVPEQLCKEAKEFFS